MFSIHGVLLPSTVAAAEAVCSIEPLLITLDRISFNLEFEALFFNISGKWQLIQDMRKSKV